MKIRSGFVSNSSSSSFLICSPPKSAMSREEKLAYLKKEYGVTPENVTETTRPINKRQLDYILNKECFLFSVWTEDMESIDSIEQELKAEALSAGGY